MRRKAETWCVNGEVGTGISWLVWVAGVGSLARSEYEK